jgi:hypothetical protein
MMGAIHFHVTQLNDKPEALVLQFALVAASILVMLLDTPSKVVAAKPKKQ